MKQTYTPHNYTQHQIDGILKCRADPQYLRTVISEEQWKREYECDFIDTPVQQISLF